VTNYSASRLQGGTQTPTGGVRAGDVLPSSFSVARMYPAQESAFPFKVWEGQLTDAADALLISPLIWEHDGGTNYFSQWVQYQSVLNNTIFMEPTVQSRVGSRTFGMVQVGGLDPSDPTGAWYIAGRHDTPVGRSGGGYGIPNTTLVLTREIIEQTLAAQWAKAMPSVVPGQLLTIPKPGILVVNFTNPPGGLFATSAPASYSLILQVEKVGG
jgi:hypothetical protein